MQKFADFVKRHAFFLLGGACIILAGVLYTACAREAVIQPTGEVVFHAAQNSDEAAETPETAEAKDDPTYFIVHISGAVNSPGVFGLPKDSRVNDVLELAGGATEDADLEHPSLNLAASIHDAMRIIIPAWGDEIDDIFPDTFPSDEARGMINLNTATSAELQTLSGVGPVLAQNIIDFREAQGGFSSVEELIHVSGIGETRLNNLRSHVTVR
ncbi:MAG: helix-hairpin-helix domain-containing protein [Defluviitaleaceae bacterium]|nr:helix-hairpin-helix domain-containing protein [Defluviitaleaceae bacterium]